MDDEDRVYGGYTNEGAIIVSPSFKMHLRNR
jgi:hypothetical protein